MTRTEKSYHQLKSHIRMINKPVFVELNSFIHEKNADAYQKKELVFDYPPITFESTFEKLFDGSVK
jgi:hypothetical protein